MTVPRLQALKGQGTPIVMVTAYDATFARILDHAGVDALLVGDSLGMVVKGEDDTLGVSLDEVLYHTRAVTRGNRTAHVVADMPFLSYQVSEESAIRNAGRLLAEGRAHAVKLEGGRAFASTVERLVTVGIPVMGHVGLLPQSRHKMGGFKVQGRGAEAAAILEDARAIAGAGAYALVLEGIPGKLAEEITRTVAIPTIGIGAGPGCDGQVLVCYDLLGLSPDFVPKFVKQYDGGYERMRGAVAAFAAEVRSRRFPAAEHTFGDLPSLARPTAVGG